MQDDPLRVNVSPEKQRDQLSRAARGVLLVDDAIELA